MPYHGNEPIESLWQSVYVSSDYAGLCSMAILLLSGWGGKYLVVYSHDDYRLYLHRIWSSDHVIK